MIIITVFWFFFTVDELSQRFDVCKSQPDIMKQNSMNFKAKFEVLTAVKIITKTRTCNIQQYFTAVKNVHFHMIFSNIFLIYAQNIDCGCTSEPPQ